MEKKDLKDIVRHVGAKNLIRAKRELSERDIQQVEFEVELEERTNAFKQEVIYFRGYLKRYLTTTTFIFLGSILCGWLFVQPIHTFLTTYIAQYPILASMLFVFIAVMGLLFQLIHFMRMELYYVNHEHAYEKKLSKRKIQETKKENIRQMIKSVFEIDPTTDPISTDVILSKINIAISKTELGKILSTMEVPLTRQNKQTLYSLRPKNGQC